MSEHDDERFAQAEHRVGSVLCGKYRIERVLGIGGMATVYAGMHRNGRRVAVKLLHPELSARKDIRTRFVREGLAANTVGHSGAVAVIDDDVAEDGAAFIVMERLEGKSVEQLWAESGQRLPTHVVLALTRDLCDVLAAAHRAGIVHRDIKPENLFLTDDGRLKVLDFGLAQLRDAARPKETHTGMVFGTPAFMPPEQASGQVSQIDARTDIWAVGATMFTLLSGKMVHEGETAQHFVMLSATKPARSLASVLPHPHPALVALVDRALSHDKERRWSSAETMRDAVRVATEMLLGAGARPELPGHANHVPDRAQETDDPTQKRQAALQPIGETLDALTRVEQTVHDRIPAIDGSDSSSPPTKPNARRAIAASSDTPTERTDPIDGATEVRTSPFVVEENTVKVECQRKRVSWSELRQAIEDSDRHPVAEPAADDIVQQTQVLASRPKVVAPAQSARTPVEMPISQKVLHAEPQPIAAPSARRNPQRATKTVSTRAPRVLLFVVVGAAIVGLSPLVYFVLRRPEPRPTQPPVEVRANVIESESRPPASPVAPSADDTPKTPTAASTDARSMPTRQDKRLPAPSHSTDAPMTPSVAARCAEPYRLDADGIKRWKKECLP